MQKLPKGALVIVKGGDMLGNMATLEEHDVEVQFQPSEAVSAVRIRFHLRISKLHLPIQ